MNIQIWLTDWLTDEIGVSVVCWAIDEDDVLEIDYRLLTDLKVKNLHNGTRMEWQEATV